MKILCLGGSRFLGPVLVNRLLQRGHEVTVVNRGTRQVTYNGFVKYIQTDRNEKFPHLGSYDVVIDTCAHKPSNLENFLKKVEHELFIFISTVGVYKKTGIFPLNETYSPLGGWPVFGEYNQGKVACEEFLVQSKIKYASVRPVYILGPRSHLARESFIYKRLVRGLPIVLPGNGQAVIQFVFVDEVAELIAQLIEGKTDGAYNCAGNECVTLQSLVEQMASISGTKPKLHFNPKADGLMHQTEEFPFANENIICDNEKAKNLGVKFRQFYDGLKQNFDKDYKILFS